MEEISTQIIFFEKELKCPKTIVRCRMKTLLEQDGSGHLPTVFTETLDNALNNWLGIFKPLSTSLDDSSETEKLTRILKIYKFLAVNDASLNEEISREGAHGSLSKLIKFDANRLDKEADQDVVMELQDLACEIAALTPNFPVRAAPFTLQELIDRLPLSFLILPAAADSRSEVADMESQDEFTILINQVKSRQSAQKDVGFVMWPSAVALSRWLMSNPNEILGKEVLELGAGCGLVGLVAAKIMTQQTTNSQKVAVTLTDFNDVVVKNMQQNILLNGLGGIAESVGLDFYEQEISFDGWKDKDGRIRQQVDLLLAADAVCQKEDAFALAKAMFCSLRSGGKAVVVSADSKHRFGVEFISEACIDLGFNVEAIDIREMYDGRLISMNMEKTTGFVDGMNLTMYIVRKL